MGEFEEFDLFIFLFKRNFHILCEKGHDPNPNLDPDP